MPIVYKIAKTAALCVITVIAVACGQTSSSSVPAAKTTHTFMERPTPPDPGSGAQAGKTYVPPGSVNCQASSSSCAGPWDFATPTNYLFDPSGATFGGQGGASGYWSFTVVCASPIDCNATGYPGMDLVINQHYNSNNPWIPAYNVNPGDLDGSYSACVNETDFGTSCGFQLSNLGPAKAGNNCEGSGKAIGGWFNGTDTHENEINQISEVQFIGPGVQTIVGWVYGTFGAGNFFQPNAQVSASGGVAVAQLGVSTGSPSVPIGAITGPNISEAVNAWFRLVGIIPSTATAPGSLLKAIARGSRRGASPCFSAPWDGRATAGKARRV